MTTIPDRMREAARWLAELAVDNVPTKTIREFKRWFRVPENRIALVMVRTATDRAARALRWLEGMPVQVRRQIVGDDVRRLWPMRIVKK
jgi:hypothetical protein